MWISRELAVIPLKHSCFHDSSHKEKSMSLDFQFVTEKGFLFFLTIEARTLPKWIASYKMYVIPKLRVQKLAKVKLN